MLRKPPSLVVQRVSCCKLSVSRVWALSYTQRKAGAPVTQEALLSLTRCKCHFCHLYKIANPLARSLRGAGGLKVKAEWRRGSVHLVSCTWLAEVYCVLQNPDLKQFTLQDRTSPQSHTPFFLLPFVTLSSVKC